METDLANIHGLARELGVPRAWLAAESQAGRIPALVIGRRLLFSVSAVREAIAQRAAESSVASATRSALKEGSRDDSA